MWDKVLNWVFPVGCFGCNREGLYICNKCWLRVNLVGTICPLCLRNSIGGITHPKCVSRYQIDGLVCKWRYDGVLRKAIKQFKFQSKFKIGNEIGGRMVKTIDTGGTSDWLEFGKFLESKPVVSYVPSFWMRKNVRGFNQAELLANVLARGMGLRCCGLLKKVRNTEQVGLDRKDRLGNTRWVFEFLGDLIPKHVILVDDVWTTGATMRECARLLKRAGVERVWGVVVAR